MYIKINEKKDILYLIKEIVNKFIIKVSSLFLIKNKDILNYLINKLK